MLVADSELWRLLSLELFQSCPARQSNAFSVALTVICNCDDIVINFHMTRLMIKITKVSGIMA